MGSYSEKFKFISIWIVPFLVAVVFHEFAHGWVARRWGDKTAEEAGRLTLNPVHHIDPVGTLLFPLINILSGIPLLIGWAKPVPIDPRRFRKFRPGLFFVSLAGPSMNFALANISAAILFAVIIWMPTEFFLREPLAAMAKLSVSINYALCIFNLIPIPPLDGSKMLESVLPLKAIRQYEKFSNIGRIGLLLLFITGNLQFLSYPITLFSNGTFYYMSYLFGLFGSARA